MTGQGRRIIDQSQTRLAPVISDCLYFSPLSPMVLWPYVGHDLPIFLQGCCFETILVLYGWVVSPTPNPQQCWRTDGLHLRLVSHCQPAWHRMPIASITWCSGARTLSVHGDLSVLANFYGAPRPKEIYNTSVYQVVRSKQLNNYLS